MIDQQGNIWRKWHCECKDRKDDEYYLFITNMKARKYPPLSIYHKEMTERKYKLVKRGEWLEFSGIYSFEWYGSQRRRKESIHGRHWRNSSKTMKEFMKDVWRAISQLETQSCPPWQIEKKF